MLDLRDDALSLSLLSVEPPFPSRHSRLVCSTADGSPSARWGSRASDRGDPESTEDPRGWPGNVGGEADVGWIEGFESSIWKSWIRLWDVGVDIRAQMSSCEACDKLRQDSEGRQRCGEESSRLRVDVPVGAPDKRQEYSSVSLGGCRHNVGWDWLMVVGLALRGLL